MMIRRLRNACAIAFCTVAFLAATFRSQAGQPAQTTAVEQQGRIAVERGLNWLARLQDSGGSWSDRSYPALTGLPLWAFAQSRHPRRDACVSNAVQYLLGCVQKDGGIYKSTLLTGGLTTYNTAVCMVALHAVKDPALTPIILRARTFIAGSQIQSGDDTDGGFGYSRTTRFVHADIQNTMMAIQAMKLTADAEDSRRKGEKPAQLDWKKTIAFIERLQNSTAAGEDNAGGITYASGGSIFGTDKGKDGTVVLRSSGTMTYAGLLSLIYADLSRDDTRVRSAFDWATRHWTLEENPGVGPSGLYFYYNVMSRALSAYGVDTVPVKDRGAVNWRSEYVGKVAACQQRGDKPDEGFWVNKTSGRFWEGNPVLVTSYSILGLQSAMADVGRDAEVAK